MTGMGTRTGVGYGAIYNYQCNFRRDTMDLNSGKMGTPSAYVVLCFSTGHKSWTLFQSSTGLVKKLVACGSMQMISLIFEEKLQPRSVDFWNYDNETGLLIKKVMIMRSTSSNLKLPLHVGFTGDLGGNTIVVRWYRRKTNLHHYGYMINELRIVHSHISSHVNDTSSSEKTSLMNGPMMFHLGKIARRRFVLTRMLLKVSVWPANLPTEMQPKALLSDDYFLSRLPVVEKRLAQSGMLRLTSLSIIFFLCLGFFNQPGVEAWSKEGHMMTCRIAQLMQSRCCCLNMLMATCRPFVCGRPSPHWYKYRWTSPLHFIDTPDKACNFDYERDCHDQHGVKDMCVAGAIQNFTTQLSHYREGTSDRRHNKDRGLVILVTFHGRYPSTAKDYYAKDVNLLEEDIEGNFTDGIWSDDLASWEWQMSFLCLQTESITNIACKWGYKGVEAGETLSDDYFKSRLPIVMKRIAQGGVRLAMLLNSVFGVPQQDSLAATYAQNSFQ
ncbi:hypothetical protein HAX54_034099 [Datura stramonium]|uniref:Aspergillus nuclease S1 n=1 Tax=Datura stramonium TaxID=4076 RepID=A0ABS8VE46_DATST|nr:hypothetical protein [Datura stramonium]